MNKLTQIPSSLLGTNDFQSFQIGGAFQKPKEEDIMNRTHFSRMIKKRV